MHGVQHDSVIRKAKQLVQPFGQHTAGWRQLNVKAVTLLPQVQQRVHKASTTNTSLLSGYQTACPPPDLCCPAGSPPDHQAPDACQWCAGDQRRQLVCGLQGVQISLSIKQQHQHQQRRQQQLARWGSTKPAVSLTSASAAKSAVMWLLGVDSLVGAGVLWNSNASTFGVYVCVLILVLCVCVSTNVGRGQQVSGLHLWSRCGGLTSVLQQWYCYVISCVVTARCPGAVWPRRSGLC